MTFSEQSLYLRRLYFSAELERTFQASYYDNIRSTLRVMLGPLVAFVLFFAVRDYVFSPSPVHASEINGVVIALCLLLFGLTFHKGFARVWQPVTVGIVWAAMTLVLNGPVATALSHTPPEFSASLRPSGPPPPPPNAAEASPSPPGGPTFVPGYPSRPPGPAPNDQVEAVQLYTVLICLAAFRLPFFWALLLNCSLLLSALTILVAHMHIASNLVMMFAERSLLVLFALMLSALVQERLARSAFLANYLLDQERNDEKRKREQTEGMLQVLGQAIGGIVHDLGNLLGAVQGGAQLLEQVIEEGETDAATLKELTAIINDGAKLLNYQRLSLMEQTRVLEGKAIPVDLKPISLHHILEAAVRYQNPKLTARRRIDVAEGDLQILADEMKLVSVFMNLIGNALKYSEDGIEIFWQSHADKALIAVADQGRQGKGITVDQASQLFVAFGRLETHLRVEGTGLGLLSVRKIVEAHGGEVFIEGYADGTRNSMPFTTAPCPLPPRKGVTPPY
jgi:signal transduction histidine kinase